MSGFSLLLMLCLLVPLAVALLFLALLTYSYKPTEGYTKWVRHSASQWKQDEAAIKRVKPRRVSLDTIFADAVPVEADALIETRRMVANARTFASSGKSAVMQRKARLVRNAQIAQNQVQQIIPKRTSEDDSDKN